MELAPVPRKCISRGSPRIATVLIAALIGTGCAGESGTTATTTTSPSVSTTLAPATTAPTTTLSAAEVASAELAQDLPLIKALWRHLSDSWAGGTEAGVRAAVEANYPGLPNATFEECFARVKGVEGVKEEYVLDVASVERDDGWVPPTTDIKLVGRTYIMKVQVTVSAHNYPPRMSVDERHVTIKDGRAHSFTFLCDR